MTTTADEQITAAKEHLDQCIKHLSNVVVSRVWGWEDFKPEHQGKLIDIFHELIQQHNKLP